MKPLISIIVPVYNTKEYLSKCIDSILVQNSTIFELILIDDGSTDGSAAVCDDYASADERVIALHQKNSGVSAARNAGIELSHGEYIWFCDSDDTVLSDSVRLLVNCIASTRASMLVFPVDQVDESGNVLGQIPAPVVSKDKSLGPLQCGDLLYPYAHVIRRDVIGSTRFDTSLSLLEDRDFLYRLWWIAAGDIAVIDKPLYRYLITRSDSAVNSAAVSKYVEATAVNAAILDNEESMGRVMPAFELFASHSLGVLSLLARHGVYDDDGYRIVRKRLVSYRHYAKLLKAGLKVKYYLAVYFPVIFNLLACLTGKFKKVSLGSSVLMKNN